MTDTSGFAAYSPPVAAAAARPASATPMSAAETAKRAQIQQTANAFEASFLSTMFGEMFEGVKTEAPFGGGSGETAFRSFLMDAMAKGVMKHGGIGLSKSISREMLKMQGLS